MRPGAAGGAAERELMHELVCLFNGNKNEPPCFTPIRPQPGQREATCPTCGTRHSLDEAGRWKRVKERLATP
ncbi:hypothetical protein [Symbiobacterium terraclitae]|uniref:hypothetical protein n=1 Tax=Symbiobacterium terraclitae TaxID=557451 RepID=UPI0035B501B3